VCIVDVNGRQKAACSTPVFEGAVVRSDTPEVRAATKGALALLRANHPEDCMSCDVNGRCEFQNLVTEYDVRGEGAGAGAAPLLGGAPWFVGCGILYMEAQSWA
jgi:NADH dehydrogenase/NADH:ubiquinone oxidoreductase subunit G